MPAAMLVGTMPHRSTSSENPDRVVPLAPRTVEYLCGQCEITTTAALHPQAAVPEVWPCRRCRSAAECTEEPDEGAELIGLPIIPKLRPPKDHWTHLSERRTEEELERLLQHRLELLRAGKLHAGPSHR